MNVLLLNRDELLLSWAAKRIPHVGTSAAWGHAKAIGVMSGPKKKDKLLAVIVFHDFYPSYRTCQISAASTSPRWATRETIKNLLAFPFYQYKVNKCWLAVPHTSERVIKFCKAIGFDQEAVLRSHLGPGIHATILRMEYRDYEKRYLKPRKEPEAKEI